MLAWWSMSGSADVGLQNDVGVSSRFENTHRRRLGTLIFDELYSPKNPHKASGLDIKFRLVCGLNEKSKRNEGSLTTVTRAFINRHSQVKLS